jgi:hypothetical protein
LLLQAHRHPARVGQRRGIHQRLHLDQQRPGALAGDHHAAARLLQAAAGQEDRRGIRHLLQPGLAHREHAQLVDRAEAVLERAQHPEAAAALALEVQHRVDHVLEHARAGDAALLGDVTDQEHGRAGFLGEAHQPRGGLAHLADRAGGGGEGVGPQRLDRVGDDEPGAVFGRMREDPLDAGFRQRRHAFERKPEALGAAGDLGQRLLAGDVQPWQRGAHARGGLQQQGRLADARVAADQHHRALDQAAAEHAVEFADAGGHARMRPALHLRQRHHRRAVVAARPAGLARRRLHPARGGRLDHELGQRVPLAAAGALALPLGMVRPALGAHVGGAGPGRRLRHAAIVRAAVAGGETGSVLRPRRVCRASSGSP